MDEPLVWCEGSGLTDRRWLHTDHLGSVIMETGNAGARLNRYTYGVWGEPGVGGWSGSRFRYTGQIMLPEAQLYHYKARVYDPMFGRFMQTDPIGYDAGLNLYAYVNNDPLLQGDTTGLDPRFTWNPSTNSIHVEYGLFVSGAGVTSSTLSDVNSLAGTLRAEPGGINLSVGVVDGTGAPDAVKFDFSPGKDPMIAAAQPSGRGEGIDVTRDVGHIRSDRPDSTGALLHDILHDGPGPQIGAVDRYADVNGTSVPDAGYENNIMGTTSGTTLTTEQVLKEMMKQGANVTLQGPIPY